MADVLAFVRTGQVPGEGKRARPRQSNGDSRKDRTGKSRWWKPGANSAVEDEVAERSGSRRMGPALGVSHTSHVWEQLWEDRERKRDVQGLDSDRADES